jgi:hypothetical protein
MEEKFALSNALKSMNKRKIHLTPDSPEAPVPKHPKVHQRAVLNKKRRSSKKVSQK